MDTMEKMESAMAALTAGRLAEAQQLAGEVLNEEADHPDALYVLGVIEHRSGNSAAGEDLVRRAADIEPGAFWFHAALAEMRAAMHDNAGAVNALRAAIAIKPDSPEIVQALALNLTHLKRHDEALAAYQRVAELLPNNVDALNNLGTALRVCGRADEALNALRKAVLVDANNVSALANLTVALLGEGSFDESLRHAQAAVALAPRRAEGQYILGVILNRVGRRDDAEDAMRAAIALDSQDARPRSELADLLFAGGTLEEAVAMWRDAARLDPDNTVAGSHCLMPMNYLSGPSEVEVIDAHRAWAARFADPLIDAARRHSNTSEGHRKLRIGYVSPDFRSHPVASFLEPILRAHRRAQVEAVCFSNVLQTDLYSERLRTFAAKWIDISRQTDEQAADVIRFEGIDVLIDLAGHTADHRLGVFARRPAPVQMTYLGYPNTTGMRAMDWFVGDPITDPAGESSNYPERIARIEGGFTCYAPRTNVPDVNDLPALRNGHITFGAFLALVKLNDGVLDLWARVLREIPTAQLLVWRNTLFGRPMERLRARLIARGIPEERFTLRNDNPTQGSHLGVYHDADIALDAQPWSGHTTSCESLWMGVPFITQLGKTHRGRMAASTLTSAGCADWIARDEDEYVRIARDIAGEVNRLSETRRGLRARVAASDLCNGEKFVIAWERVIRDAWRAWCAKPRN